MMTSKKIHVNYKKKRRLSACQEMVIIKYTEDENHDFA